MTPSFTPIAAKSHSHSLSVELFESSPPTREIHKNPGKFIYTLVHEIRNPLTNINLATEILKQMARDKDQEMYVDIIMRNSARIKDIVANLLTTRHTNGMKPKTHSVRYLLEEVLLINEDRFMLKNITVRKNLSTCDFKINLNISKVKIALTNIIINAIEAMPAKNGLLEVTTKILNGACFIVIKDNGIGINKENLKNIFNPNFTNKPGGMGLGLSVTQSILNSNHIGVNVRSELGEGTRFILSYKKESI